jgi:hypothetical protein
MGSLPNLYATLFAYKVQYKMIALSQKVDLGIFSGTRYTGFNLIDADLKILEGDEMDENNISRYRGHVQCRAAPQQYAG